MVLVYLSLNEISHHLNEIQSSNFREKMRHMPRNEPLQENGIKSPDDSKRASQN